MKITIREVAKAAKVSVGTVSRVLNGNPMVSHESASRVEEAMRSMNYRRLRSRRRTIGGPENRSLSERRIALVLLGMDRSLETLPVVASAIHGVESAVSQAGGSLLMADVPVLDKLPPILRQERLDGLILKGALQGNVLGTAAPELIKRLATLPGVWILGRPDGGQGDSVNTDDVAVGKIAAEHLLACGHRRLAFLNPKPDHRVFRSRQMSFTWHAEAGGAQVRTYLAPTEKTIEFPLRPVGGIEAVQPLVDELLADKPRPTGLFVPADTVAVWVYRALAARGLQAGRELSVISCNFEPPLIGGLFPSLTTINVHAKEIGYRAIEQLITLLMTSQKGPPTQICLEPDLVLGESVKEIKRGNA